MQGIGCKVSRACPGSVLPVCDLQRARPSILQLLSIPGPLALPILHHHRHHHRHHCPRTLGTLRAKCLTLGGQMLYEHV